MHSTAFVSYCILQSAVTQLVEHKTGIKGLRVRDSHQQSHCVVSPGGYSDIFTHT